MKRFIFENILLPLMRRNFRARALGLAPDEMYWADALAMRWGFLAEYPDDLIEGYVD